VDRITRKELKTDHFATEVQHGFEYVTEHRPEVIRYGLIALAVLVIAGGWVLYSRHEHSVREDKLADVFRIEQATVGPASDQFTLSFPTQQAKDQAETKALTELATQYSGTAEGTIAQYMLASRAGDQGNIGEAQRRLTDVMNDGKGPYTSLARMQLAQLYASEGKTNDARTLLESLIAKPTAFVSKEEATIALAQMVGKTNPAEARKMLLPLLTSDRLAVSRAAMQANGALPQK
jgi:predicted negative regulator of RcsB-dependent stress response